MNRLRGQFFGLSGSSQAQLQLAGLQGLGDIVLWLHARCGGVFRDFDRIGLQLRRRRQPAHALGAHIVVDQRAVPRTCRRRRRQNFRHIERLVAPLIGVRIKRRSRIHLPRRPAPVEGECERQPARLRTQLFLADIMRPAAAGLPDATAHHQHVDDAAVVHVHVVPVVQTGADDHHRAALGLLRVERELARRRDDLIARHAGDLLRPGRRVGLQIVVALGQVARRRNRDRHRNWRRTDRTPTRPASRPRPVAVSSPARCAPARRDDRFRGSGRARDCRNRGSRPRRRRL